MRHRTSNRRRRRSIRSAAIALAASLAFVALVGTSCSSDDEGASTAKSTSTTTTAPTTSDASAAADPNATPSTPPTAPSGPEAAAIRNSSEVSTSTIPKADVVPFPRSACQALTDDEVAAAPWSSIRNAKVVRSGVDDAGAACGWQITGDGGSAYTLRVAFVPRAKFDSDVSEASGLQKLTYGDESYLLAGAPNITPATNSVWVRVGDNVAQIDGESVASAEQLAAIVASRL